MKAVVLGGYGLIGSAVMRALAAAGFDVTGVGRSAAAARRMGPGFNWILRDISSVETPEWRNVLRDADVVVNAAGALQDGGRDDLTAIHETAIGRIAAALEGTATRVVQISAAGVGPHASTEFFRSKERGDAILQSSGLDHVILRPVLVIGPAAYGGTALLRAAAAIPLIGLQILPGAQVQTVALDDLARAVVLAAQGAITPGTVADLTEAESRSFPELVQTVRRWQGRPDPKMRLRLPGVLLKASSAMADLLGHLGWRAPLRSTAIRALSDGIAGDPGAWQAAGGFRCRSLDETLAALPSTVQERWFARMFLLFPLLILLLALFWGLSGAIGLIRFDAAVAVLTERGVAMGPAQGAVALGALVDLVLGLAVLSRRWLRPGLIGMIAVSLGYLICGTVLTPDIWTDPLGPFVKVLPGIGLALAVLGLTDDR